MTVQLGLDRCLEDPRLLGGGRFGLLMNQASLGSSKRYACDLLAERFPGQLQTLFTPQHGLWCEEQDNMIETPHSVYGPLGVPVYSLYSETRRPTEEMLGELDCLVVDLQDVGTRVYTFIWTMTHCLEACAAAGLKVIVLDRPNPLGGRIVEGPRLQETFRSFVGLAEIPMRHGLTIGEMAQFVNQSLGIGARLEVIPMGGWQRELLWPATGRAWFPPSPNMPRFETALVYPGQVLLEGTNLSEGRGTTTPFEIAGAPYIDPHALVADLKAYELPGLVALPVRFRPTFNKWSGESCGGVFLAADAEETVRSYQATLALIAAIQRRWPDEFHWTLPPYEYESEKPPIDILVGSDELRRAAVEGTLSPEAVKDLSSVDAEAWWREVQGSLLY